MDGDRDSRVSLKGPEAAPGWPPSAAATEKSNPTYAASKLGTVPYPVFGHDLMEAASRDPKSEVFVILGHLENEEWRGLARIECLLSSLARRVYAPTTHIRNVGFRV